MKDAYLVKVDKKMDEITKKHVTIGRKIAELEGKLRPLKRESEKLFTEYHRFRDIGQVYQETGKKVNF